MIEAIEICKRGDTFNKDNSMKIPWGPVGAAVDFMTAPHGYVRGTETDAV